MRGDGCGAMPSMYEECMKSSARALHDDLMLVRQCHGVLRWDRHLEHAEQPLDLLGPTRRFDHLGAAPVTLAEARAQVDAHFDMSDYQRTWKLCSCVRCEEAVRVLRAAVRAEETARDAR